MSHLDTINQTFAAIGKVPFSSLSVPYVSYRYKIGGELAQYSLKDVFADYHGETAVQTAFIEMLEKSTCPWVQVYRNAVQMCFEAQNKDELEMLEEA